MTETVGGGGGGGGGVYTSPVLATYFLCYKIEFHNLFEHNTDYLMSCSTGVLLLHALQQLKPTCLVPRPHPDFISQTWLRDKIWVGPGDKATVELDPDM